MEWDPAQYAKFPGHRIRPALDLLTRIPPTGSVHSRLISVAVPAT